MKTRDAIKAISGYPIPSAAIDNIIDEAGLDPEADLTAEARQGDGFRKAKALAYAFLAEAPNVTQGGISYSFCQSERTRFERKAEGILAELGADDGGQVQCGYIGEDF